MSITDINGSNISPHLRKLVDDIISMTSKIVLKLTDVANSYETTSTVRTYEYYRQILNGDDTLGSYDKIPYQVFRNILAWIEVGYESIDDFPSNIDHMQKSIPMRNKLNTCYIGTDDPSSVQYKDFGNKYDGYIQIKSSEIRKLDLFSKDSVGWMTEIKDMNLIDFESATTDKSKYNFNELYCKLTDTSDFVKIVDIPNRYELTEDGEYKYSDIGTYYYDITTSYYIRKNRFEPFQIENMISTGVIPEIYKDEVLESMRKYIIDNYIQPDLSPPTDFSVKRYFGEQNSYYRQLNGLPPVSRMESQPSVLLDELIGGEYIGTNTIKKLYELTDREVELIKENGKYDELFDKYSSIGYLKYMGKDRIDVMDARDASSFEILRTGSYNNISHYNIFISNFHTAKDYIIRRFYNPELFSSHEYYSSYIGYMITCQAMCQCVAHNDSILLNYLYSDEETVRLRLMSYGLNVFDDIPLVYRRNISKYIEKLITNKGTDSIYPIIIDLFDVDNIEVYKYFYRRLRDKNGNIELSMSQVPVGTENFINEITKDINKVSYDEVTQNDIYWGACGLPINITKGNVDQYLKDIITNVPFNYMNSKYISINAIFNLSKLNFNASYLMNYLLELSKRDNLISLMVDGINGKQTLFDLIVLLFAIQAKRLKYDGNIQHDAASVAYVLKYNLDETVTVNGEEISILEFYKKYHSDSYYKYLIETNKRIPISSIIKNDNNINDTLSQIKTEIDSTDQSEYLDNLLDLQIPVDISLSNIAETYLHNSGLDGAYDNIIKMREDADSFSEYKCYDELLKALTIAKLNNEIFSLSNPIWVEIDNFITWNEIVDDSLKEKIYNEYINIIQNNEVYDGNVTIDGDDHVICWSHGYPNLLLGSNDKINYCIDVDTINSSGYDSSVKIYVKDYIITENIPAISNTKMLVGEDNYLYFIEIPKEVNINDSPEISQLDLSCDIPYCYDLVSGKLYMYLKYARTYQEYLQYENKDLYNLIQNNLIAPSPDDAKYNEKLNSYHNELELYYDSLDALYTNIIVAIEDSTNNEQLRKIVNTSFTDLNVLSNYIKKVITVFKSFEVDIATINIIYEIDDPNNYRVKIIDDLSIDSNDYLDNHFHLLQELCVDEESTFYDTINIYDELNIEERKATIS